MKDSNSSTGLGFASVLGIVFIVLKLCKVINWSWVWVLCPFWIGLAGWRIFILIIAIIMSR
jgi:hypothetical protein|nr:MAG TPA: Melanocortin-2 receptor accessory protein family [Bacteriophage sp.]